MCHEFNFRKMVNMLKQVTIEKVVCKVACSSPVLVKVYATNSQLALEHPKCCWSGNSNEQKLTFLNQEFLS